MGRTSASRVVSGRDPAVVGPELRRCHTADLSTAALDELRALLDLAFEGCFTDDDWRHGLGGPHVLARLDGRLVACGALVQRRLRHRGRELRAGYVEAVAVHPAHRREGLGSAVMGVLEAERGRHDLLALSATEDGQALYEARGWRQWRGATSVLADGGVVRTPEDDGSVYVLPGEADPDPYLDLDDELTCDDREGDPW